MKNTKNTKHLEERLKDRRDYRTTLIQRREDLERKISDLERKISAVEAQIKDIKSASIAA